MVFLLASMASLSQAAPVPPLALLSRKQRVACLSYGGGENVLAADIDALPCDSAELLIKPCWTLPRKVFHAADTEQFKVAEHGWPHRD
jgi:hypothetical protein